jgi:hypothetical protein
VLVGRGLEILLGHALVRESEVHGLLALRALAEHHHRLRARQADEARQQIRTAGIDDEAPLRERPHEPRSRVYEHEVARQREVGTGADGRAVHTGNGRLVELPQLADERLHTDAQRLRGAPRFVAGLRRLHHRRRREVHARAERVARAREEQRAHVVVLARRAYGVDDPVAHLDRERVLRVGAVERDAADVVGADLVANHPILGLSSGGVSCWW